MASIPGRELTHKPLKEEIYDALHRQIIAGKYVTGEWLWQEEISSQLGFIQTPVREALDLLVSAGLAERVPYRGVRVLQLTTDEILDAYIMRIILESKKYRVRVAYNGKDGYQRIEEKAPDLIVLDVMMTTDTEGFDFAYKLRNNPQYKHIPIVMTTGFPQKMAEQGPEKFQHIMGMEWPVSHLLEKPIDPEEFLSIVGAFLKEAGKAISRSNILAGRISKTRFEALGGKFCLDFFLSGSPFYHNHSYLLSLDCLGKAGRQAHHGQLLCADCCPVSG